MKAMLLFSKTTYLILCLTIATLVLANTCIG